MTNTPTSPTNSAAPGFGLPGLRKRGRAAGRLFGINLADLFDSEEGGSDFQGFVSPEQTTTYYKGRSPSTLTYRAPKLSARAVTSSVFGGADDALISPEPTKPESQANSLLSSFIGDMGDPNKKVLGAVGLGRAMESGLSQEDILDKAKTEGMTFGKEAATTLGLSNLLQYQGPQAEGKTIGLTALEGARMAGMSDELIKQFAKEQGLGFGEKAAAELGVPKVTELSQYVGPGGTEGTLGLEALNRAQQAGLTNEQITTLAKEQGVGFGEKAAAKLGVPKVTDLSQYIGSTGNVGTLGLAAVNRAKSAGLSDTQIRDLAEQQGLGFGAGAARRLGTLSASQRATSGRSSNVPNLSKFIGPGGNAGTLGLEALNAARSSGLSDTQIKRLASSQGLRFGAGARAALG